MSLLFPMLFLLQLSPGSAIADSAKPEPFPDVTEEQDLAASPARSVTAAFAGCVAERSPERVRDLLTKDFTKTSFRFALDSLARANNDCFGKVGGRGRLGMGELPLAAALAEAMIKSDAAPLNVRLARAAAAKESPTYSLSDKVAMCVVRSVPDDVARLFATDVATPEETQAATALAPVVTACARVAHTPPIQADAFGLRSIVASAAFRLLAAQES